MTFLLKEAGFVLVGRGSFLPRVQPAKGEVGTEEEYLDNTKGTLFKIKV